MEKELTATTSMTRLGFCQSSGSHSSEKFFWRSFSR